MKKSKIEDIAVRMMLPYEDCSDEELICLMEEVKDINSTDRDGRTLLINAVTSHRIALVSYLLSKNANLDVQDKLGYTALHAAVDVQDYGITQLLLDHKANVHITDLWGNTPLFRTSHLHPELVRLLVEYGANPKQSNSYGITPYQMYQAYPEILQLFDLKHGGNGL